jgi:hypothetical protein
MSAGHDYDLLGWCTHPQCMRHANDPNDLCFCPDREGYHKEADLPPAKAKARKDARMLSVMRAGVEMIARMLR